MWTKIFYKTSQFEGTTTSTYDNSSSKDCGNKYARKQNMGQILIATKHVKEGHPMVSATS